jgi:hypothetical protein
MDFSLLEDSPCIDSGIETIITIQGDTLKVKDFQGDNPDMGAIESPYYSGLSKLKYYTPKYKLSQNYPNPFNPSTTIEFALPKTNAVTLKIYNILGEEVVTLVSDRLTDGSYSYEWSRPAGIASGVYLYQLKAGDFVETRKMVLMR